LHGDVLAPANIAFDLLEPKTRRQMEPTIISSVSSILLLVFSIS